MVLQDDRCRQSRLETVRGVVRDDAARILADEAARREAIFQQSVVNERTRGDALSKRFEEALKQAREEPITRPARDFDLD